MISNNQLNSNHNTKENDQMNAKLTEDQINAAQILESLAALTGKTLSQDEPILQFPNTNPVTVQAKERRIGLPETTTVPKAIEILTEYEAGLKEVTQVKHDFDARFEEVMVATQRVFRRVFGTVGRGKKIESFFGSEPPRTMNFVVGLDSDGNKVIEYSVPVSAFAFAPLGTNAQITPSGWNHPQYGTLGSLIFEVRKANVPAVEGLVKLIQDEIKTASIYKGQVLDLARGNDGRSEYDLRHRHVKTDRNLVYNPDVAQDLTYELWGNIEYAKQFDANGIKPVFRVGMEGIYGSGKTETAMHTARKASEHGMTAIIVKPSVTDRITDLVSAFRIAEMYAPSILVIEDWDKFFTSPNYSTADESAITNLLDGADSKTHQVNLLWTTNNLADIPKSMMRNGRTDCTITFGPLDREPVEQMYHAVLGGQLRDDVDFDKVYEEVKDLGPSFIRGTFDKARKYSIISNRGVAGQPLGTEDLIQAARVMKKQDERFSAAKATERKVVTFDSLLRTMMRGETAQVLGVTEIDVNDGEVMVHSDRLTEV